MKLLALDTSTDACSVAITDGHETWSDFAVCPREHNSRLPEMLTATLAASGMAYADLDAVVCGVGPGSFTGIRIAVGFAQGLAAALRVPVYPVTGTASMSAKTFEERPEATKVAIAIDARMGELYWAIYRRCNNALVAVDKPECLVRPDDLLLPDGQDWVATGGAWQLPDSAQAMALQARGVDFVETWPDALLMLSLVQAQGPELTTPAPQSVAADQLQPLYLRNQVAAKSKARA